MFSIKEHCLAEKPSSNEFVKYYHHNWQNFIDITDMVPPLYPTINHTNGGLYITDQDGTSKYMYDANNFAILIQNAMFATLHKGIIKIYIDNRGYSAYIHLPKLQEATYLFRSVIMFQDIEEPVFIPHLATNRLLKEDYSQPFNIKFYNYQSNNIRWMKNIEFLTLSHRSKISIPDLKSRNLRRCQIDGRQFLYSEVANELYPSSYEEILPVIDYEIPGGLLCDEVGLGKTFTVYGLIMNTLDVVHDIPMGSRIKKSNATLIVVPTRLIGQWVSEFQKFVKKDTHQIVKIASITDIRKKKVEDLMASDIVIVSDRFLINKSYESHVASGGYKLENLYWKRIVIDEGHEYMNYDYGQTTQRIKYKLMSLKGSFKWLLTATPFPQQRCNMDNYMNFFNGSANTNQFDNKHYNIFLRDYTRCNTYESIKDQISIPPIQQTTVLLTQDPVERAMYVNETSNPIRMIQMCTNILISGHGVIGENEFVKLEDVKNRMIKYFDKESDKLRKLVEECDNTIQQEEQEIEKYKDDKNSLQYKIHKDAYKICKDAKEKFEKEISSLVSRKKLFEDVEERATNDNCVICMGEINEIALTKCSHIFCRECISQSIARDRRCPMCRTDLNPSVDIGYMMVGNASVNKNGRYYKHVQKWGTKMAWLVQYLKEILKDNETRVILFSQWKKMLNLVGHVLSESDIGHVYLKGAANTLSKSMKTFKTSKDKRVIMLSSETSNSGSNLTEASHVILLDTFNGTPEQTKAIEDQAVGRASRLGQDKVVDVIRLIMKNTIEYDHYTRNISHEDIEEIEGGENKLI